MTKFLLLMVLAVVVGWLWRKSVAAHARSAEQPPLAPSEAEDMVKCAQCGVNQPVSDSILVGGRYYCCAAHRQLAESAESKRR